MTEHSRIDSSYFS